MTYSYTSLRVSVGFSVPNTARLRRIVGWVSLRLTQRIPSHGWVTLREGYAYVTKGPTYISFDLELIRAVLSGFRATEECITLDGFTATFDTN